MGGLSGAAGWFVPWEGAAKDGTCFSTSRPGGRGWCCGPCCCHALLTQLRNGTDILPCRPLAMLFRDAGAATVTVLHRTSYRELFADATSAEVG